MKRISTRVILAAAITWLALSALSLILGLLLFNPYPSYNLSKNGIRTIGQVTALEPTNHQVVRYTYVVDSLEYLGSGNAGHGNPPFENIRVGQSVLVFYDPMNPKVSSLGYPQARLYGNVWVAVMVALVLPSFILAALIRKGFFD